MQKKTYYERYLSKLPEGIKRCVAEILLDHRGKENAISRRDLVSQTLIMLGENPLLMTPEQLAAKDRKVRRAVELIRNDVILVGSSLGGEGYFLITTQEEWSEFFNQFTKPHRSALETAYKMKPVAEGMLSGQLMMFPEQAR